LSVVNEDLLRAFEEKIRENRRFATTSLSLHFPQISWSLLHQIVSGKVNFRKLCEHCLPKLFMEEHKLEQQATTLHFLTQYSEEGENFLSHVATGNETWVSHEAPESKQQAMEWRLHFIANKDKIQAEHFNSEGHVHNVLGQKRRSACGLLASKFHNQRRCLLQHTSKIAPPDPE